MGPTKSVEYAETGREAPVSQLTVKCCSRPPNKEMGSISMGRKKDEGKGLDVGRMLMAGVQMESRMTERGEKSRNESWKMV